MSTVEKIPVYWRKSGRKWKERRDVDRIYLASYETEGQSIKAEAERGKTGGPTIGSPRLSDAATAFLKKGDR